MWSTVLVCHYLRSKAVPWIFFFDFLSYNFDSFNFSSCVSMPECDGGPCCRLWWIGLCYCWPKSATNNLHGNTPLYQKHLIYIYLWIPVFYTLLIFAFCVSECHISLLEDSARHLMSTQFFDRITLYSEKKWCGQDLVLLELFRCWSVILVSPILNCSL